MQSNQTLTDVNDPELLKQIYSIRMLTENLKEVDSEGMLTKKGEKFDEWLLKQKEDLKESFMDFGRGLCWALVNDDEFMRDFGSILANSSYDEKRYCEELLNFCNKSNDHYDSTGSEIIATFKKYMPKLILLEKEFAKLANNSNQEGEVKKHSEEKTNTPDVAKKTTDVMSTDREKMIVMLTYLHKQLWHPDGLLKYQGDKLFDKTKNIGEFLAEITEIPSLVEARKMIPKNYKFEEKSIDELRYKLDDINGLINNKNSQAHINSASPAVQDFFESYKLQFEEMCSSFRLVAI